MTLNLQTLTIAQAAPLIASRQLSPVELTEAHLAAIAAEDDNLRSFITVTADLARQQARQAEQEIMAGHYRGVLHGIPLAQKDNIESAGIRTTCGSIMLDGHIPTENAFALQKLEDAGAILLGKTNTHEWTISVTTDNPFYGRCRNPRDKSRIPGGSSGGSAAALAAGLCMGSLGSDTGGSIRLPAALCGIVGFKPTFGRISRRGVIPLSFSLDHVGPMARTVYDTALLYQVVGGYDAADPYCFHQAVGNELDAMATDSPARLKGAKVAVAIRDFDRDGKAPNPEVVAAVMATASRLETVGAIVEEVELPRMGDVGSANSRMLVTEGADYHTARFDPESDHYSAYMRAALERGRGISGIMYAQARKLQAEVTREMELFFERYDLLLTPTSPVPAPVHDESPEAQAARMWLVAYTAPFNFTGNPALSIPCGTTSDGLPIGVQLVGKRFDDWQVLRVGHILEGKA